MGQKPLVTAIVGPTASGKSDLALRMAEKYNGEIICCDSMQIYKGMDIGTAKPSTDDFTRVRHHLFDIEDPLQGRSFSVATYVKLARDCVNDVLSRGKLPILCGGTGLYLDAFIRGGGFDESETDPTFHRQLKDIAESAPDGPARLHAMLEEIDPESAKAIHRNNVKRVIRALEIYHLTGKTKSESDRESLKIDSPYRFCVIGLTCLNRQWLYDRIDRRVDMMVAAGLPDETRRLRDAGVFEACQTASQAIGYKELFPFLDGKDSLENCVNALKISTRHYAKRQLTWFMSKSYVEWIYCDGPDGTKDFDELMKNAEKSFQSYQ